MKSFYPIIILISLLGISYSSAKTVPISKKCSSVFTQASRFQRLLKNIKNSERKLKLSDTILYEDQHFIITPGLGSITPLYILFISKHRLFNFAQVSKYYNQKPLTLISNILSKHFSYDENFIWFEHGEITSGAIFGSNIDHGHIHIILNPSFTLESFRLKAMSMDRQHWRFVTTETAYNNRNAQRSYLAFGDKNKAFWANLKKPRRPQFFRRVVAKLVGKTNEWNYRKHPHNEMITETISFMEQQKQNSFR